jgi:hypothetical protein
MDPGSVNELFESGAELRVSVMNQVVTWRTDPV